MKVIRYLLLTQIIVISGCVLYIPEQSNPNTYYVDPATSLDGIGRVVFVELSNDSGAYSISPQVTEAVYQEFQKKQLFSLTRLSQDDPRWRQMQIDVAPDYTLKELTLLRQTLRCDAILAGTITEFKPYPHMILGLRLQLVDLSDGHLCWAMEQIWDTTDKTTKDRIESYYNPRHWMRDDDNLKGQLGSVSSLKFFKFVAYEIAQTLTPDD